MEIAQLQASGMENANTVNFTKSKTSDKSKERQKFQLQKNTTATKCYNCGGNWPHKERPCPAKGKECRKCNKVGHFAKVCKSTKKQTYTRRSDTKSKINNIEDSSDDECVFSIKGKGHVIYLNFM